MTAFLKSDLFLRFLGGFVVGVIGMVALTPNEQTIAPPAIAASAPASVPDHAAL